jgi:hypothetical protein
MQQMKNPNLFPMGRGSDFSCVVEAMGVEQLKMIDCRQKCIWDA